MRELLVRKKGHGMSSSWQDTSIVITNCQQPLMLTLGWHKNRPTNGQAQMEEGLTAESFATERLREKRRHFLQLCMDW